MVRVSLSQMFSYPGLTSAGPSAIVGGRTQLTADPFSVEPMEEGVLLGTFRVLLRRSFMNQLPSSGQPVGRSHYVVNWHLLSVPVENADVIHQESANNGYTSNYFGVGKQVAS